MHPMEFAVKALCLIVFVTTSSVLGLIASRWTALYFRKDRDWVKNMTDFGWLLPALLNIGILCWLWYHNDQSDGAFIFSCVVAHLSALVVPLIALSAIGIDYLILIASAFTDALFKHTVSIDPETKQFKRN